MKKITYKKILVTHDGSQLASAALPHAATLARMYNAEILLLQVVRSVEQEIATTTLVGIGMYPVVSDLSSDSVKEDKKQARHHLEKLTTELEAEGVGKIQIIVKEGSAEDVINKVAKTEHCDLIVMSTHGRSGLGRALLGSVTDYVIRHAHCPVLVVHPEKGGE